MFCRDFRSFLGEAPFFGTKRSQVRILSARLATLGISRRCFISGRHPRVSSTGTWIRFRKNLRLILITCILIARTARRKARMPNIRQITHADQIGFNDDEPPRGASHPSTSMAAASSRRLRPRRLRGSRREISTAPGGRSCARNARTVAHPSLVAFEVPELNLTTEATAT